MPAPMRMFATRMCHTSDENSSVNAVRGDERDRAEEQQELRAGARGDAPRRSARAPSSRARQASRSGSRPAATARTRRRSRPAAPASAGTPRSTRTARTPSPTDARFVSSTAAPRGDAQVEQRLGDAQLEPAPQQQHDEAAEPEAEHGRRAPSPTRCRARSRAGCRSARPRGPAAPTKSKRPAVRSTLTGTIHSTSAKHDDARGRRPARTARASRCARSRAR